MSSLWDRYQKYLVQYDALGFARNHLAANAAPVRKQTGAVPGADTFLLT